jgi:hypothetical protein
MVTFPKLGAPAEIMRIHEKICSILREFVFFDSAQATHLRSLVGALPQEIHLDFDPATPGMSEAFIAKNGSGTHFAVFAIENCSLYIAVSSHNAVHEFVSTGAISASTKSSVKMIKIVMSPGQLIIVRGDVIHAGGEYPGSQTFPRKKDFVDRLHYYLDNNGICRDSNRTWLSKPLMDKLGSEFDTFQLWLKEKKDKKDKKENAKRLAMKRTRLKWKERKNC